MTTANRLPAPPPRPQHAFRPALTELSAPAQRPRSIAWSARLWLAAVGLSLFTTVLAVVDLDRLHAGLLADVVLRFPTEAPAARERVVAAALLILIGSGLLVALLQGAFALAMGARVRRARRRRARQALVPLWLLGAVHAVVTCGTLASPILLGLPVAVIVSTVAVVAMFRPASNAWLAGHAGRHRARGRS